MALYVSLKNTLIFISIHVLLCFVAGKARIRVQLSAGHSLQNVDTAVDAFIETGKQLKVIS